MPSPSVAPALHSGPTSSRVSPLPVIHLKVTVILITPIIAPIPLYLPGNREPLKDSGKTFWRGQTVGDLNGSIRSFLSSLFSLSSLLHSDDSVLRPWKLTILLFCLLHNILTSNPKDWNPPLVTSKMDSVFTFSAAASISFFTFCTSQRLKTLIAQLLYRKKKQLFLFSYYKTKTYTLSGFWKVKKIEKKKSLIFSPTDEHLAIFF